MAKENSSTRPEHDMMVSGLMIMPMATGSSSILMAISLKGIGSKERNRGKERITITTAHVTAGTGPMTKRTAKAHSPTTTVINTLVDGSTVIRTGKEFTTLRTAIVTKDNGKGTKGMDLERCSSRMVIISVGTG